MRACRCGAQEARARSMRVTAGHGIVSDTAGPVPVLTEPDDIALAEFLATHPQGGKRIDLKNALEDAGIPFDATDLCMSLAARCAHAHTCASRVHLGRLSRAAIQGGYPGQGHARSRAHQTRQGRMHLCVAQACR